MKWRVLHPDGAWTSLHAHVMRDPGVCLLYREGVSDRVLTVADLCDLEFNSGQPAVFVHLVNSTPEADGTRREFWRRVHPELRPLLGDGQLGEPQARTARNAVASTYGMRGEEYAPLAQT